MTRDQNKGINLANSENNAGVNPTVAYGDDSYSAEGKAATESFEALYEAERRARAEATARANELEAIFEAMADAVFFYDRQGHLLRTNAAARELLGLDQSPGYHSLPPDERLVHFLPRDARGRPLPEQQWPIHRILSGEGLTGANAMDMMVRLPDGRELEFSVSGAPLRDTKGNITGGVVITRDVTERRRLERMAQGFAREAVARASQLEATIEAMADGVFIYDAEGRLLQANKAARELLALDIQLDFLSRPVRERASQTLVRDEQGQFLPREQWPLHRILRGEILEGTNAVDVMLRALDGREVLLGTSGAPVRDAEGHIAGGVLIMRDVTERRHLEQRTHASLNALLAIAEDLVWIPSEASSAEDPLPDTLTAMSIVARRLADLTCSVLGCRRVSISIVEPGTELVRAVAIVGLTPEQERQWWAEQKQQESSLRDSPSQELISILRSHEVLILDMSQPPYNEQPNNYGVRVALVAPMVVGGQLVGLLSLDHGGLEHTYTQEEIALAKAVAKLAGLVIERERLLYERAEARANELALRESHQRMDEFLSMASHELRTPLTTIKGNVQLSKRQLKKLAGKITKPEELNGQIGAIEGLLDRADHQVSFLTRLVSDLLDVSRIQVNMLELHIQSEPSDLVAIVRMAVQDQRRALPKRTLHLQAPSEMIVPVIVDPERIGQVVTNYLTNAFKYSPADKPVEISVRVEENQARVSVRDEGPGLSLEEQERIWDQFYRVPGVEVHSGSSVGLGLGLHICRTIIERHHGRVGVQSAPGKGATFWFVLPLAGDA
jgi:signal transduction histidine kinase